MKQNNYFNKDGKHYFTEEEKQALQDLINHLEESHKKFWEEWEEQKRMEVKMNVRVARSRVKVCGDNDAARL